MLTKIASYLFIYYPMAPLSHIATEHSHPIQASKLEIAPCCNGHHDKKTEMFIRGTSEINPVTINTTKKARKLTLSGKIDKM
jgi:hypothetical protein